MADFQADAQHPATPVRLQQAQRQGDVPKSQELASTIQLACGLGVIYLSIKSIANQFTELTTQFWATTRASQFAGDQLNDSIVEILIQSALLVIPILLCIWAFNILAHVIQTPSISFNNQRLINTAALNPAQRIQRLFSTDSLLRSVLGIPKIGIIGTAFLGVTWHMRTQIANLPFQSSPAMMAEMLDCVFTILMACVLSMIVAAIADYLIERYAHARRLRMSDQELREENRLQQGDPQVSNRRSLIFQEIVGRESI